MLLEIYDKNTLDRVDIIRTYTFVQYTDYFNDIGTFTIKVPITESSLSHLMIAGNYILFEKLGEKLVMGVIKYFHKEGVSNVVVEIQGYMLSHILTYRCFEKTYRKHGRIFDIQREFVTKQFINPDDLRRQITPLVLSFEYDNSTEIIDYCKTGSNAAEAIIDMNSPYHYGFSIVPAIAKYNPQTGKYQNIANMVFEQYVPTDHRIGNVYNNSPVVFDTELNNVEDLMFELDSTKAKTVAIVAGQDTGENRAVIEVGDKVAFGFDRNELYVDARDLQKNESDKFDFSTNKMVGDSTDQIVWNSFSVSSMRDIQINSFTISGFLSVDNENTDDESIMLYVVPYLGNVSYNPVILVDEVALSQTITNYDFFETLNSSDNGLDYYDSYVVFCRTQPGVEYKIGGEMEVKSIPEQNYATTDEEYEEMLAERGQEELKENSISYGFESTVFTGMNNSFVYGVDYKNGDYVSVIDRDLGMAVGVQITGIRKSLSEIGGEILDLIFDNQFL